MLGIHDPFMFAAVVVGVVGALAIVGVIVALTWKRLGAWLNYLFARPVYLLDLYLRGAQEWERHRHSPMYVQMAQVPLFKVEDVEDWLKEQEPELVVAA